MADVTLSDQLRQLGHGDVTVHGFRSTFRDWAADTGKPADLAEAALAHVSGSAVVRAYARSDLLEARRSLMAAWADFLTNAVVVPLRAASLSSLAAPPGHLRSLDDRAQLLARLRHALSRRAGQDFRPPSLVESGDPRRSVGQHPAACTA